jgi:membrane-associated phospholipid phosphatase
MTGHGIGAVGVAQDLLAPFVPVFALLTQLGDVWFLLGLLATLYLGGDHLPGLRDRLDRPRVAYVIALAIGALALSTGLKLLVGLPRPTGAGTPVDVAWVPGSLDPLYEGAVSTDGHGFPSGHALGATVVYGGLALVVGEGLTRRRLAATGVLVGAIGFARVVIGVHHLSSVLGGFAIGLAYLAVVTRLTDGGRRVALAYLLAVFAGVFALFGGGFERDTVVALGTALGGRLTWQTMGAGVPDGPASTRDTGLLVVVGLTTVGGLFGVIEGVEPPLSVTFLLAALLVGLLLVLPLAWTKTKEGRAAQKVSR